VVNTLRHLKRLTGADSIHAVIGGMHLEKASMNRVHLTIRAMNELGVEKVIPVHCTGFAACAEMARLLGDRFVSGGAGDVFVF
jgi:7,8-dihydropterin-6-yl-methyl-4-(beta-D-ribofuranosyl)aminobenzene 5'-phosphate synthase